MNEIRLTETVWSRAITHLFGSKNERIGFFYAEPVRTSEGTILIITDFRKVNDEEVQNTKTSIEVRIDTLLDIINEAVKKNLSLIEIHTHLFEDEARFSLADERGFAEFIPYITNSLPRTPYAALVVTPGNNFEGRLWNEYGQSQSVYCMKIIGSNLTKLVSTFGKRFCRYNSNTSPNQNTYERQIIAFSETGQQKISEINVAIVGLGGLGSHIAQQLTYLGVKNFLLIDPDIIEISNLNRLIGAHPADLGLLKVEIVERMIQKISGNKSIVKKYSKDLRSGEVLSALKNVDLIFGCLDKSGPRLILNEFCQSYLVHYIDTGTEIIVDSHSDSKFMKYGGGQIIIVSPEGPCMICANLLDIHEAATDLLPHREYEANLKRGYISGAPQASASVVSLNGIIASMAVTEFVMLVTSFRPPKALLCYDILEGKVASRKLKRDTECIHNIYRSSGDRCGLERFYNRV